MSRWGSLWICALLGLALIVCGLLVPAHLRALDVSVVERAGRGTPFLVERGLVLAHEKQLGAAQLLLQVAQDEKSPGWEKLAASVSSLAKEHPELRVLGGPEARLEKLAGASGSVSEPFTDWVVRSENREKVLGLLGGSKNPAVLEVLKTRGLTNTTIFPAAQSSSGQAFDAAVAVCGLLLEDGHLTKGLRDALDSQATKANHGGDTQLLEQALLDLMSLGQRFNWGQLAVFVGRVEEVETLRLLANLARNAAEAPAAVGASNVFGAGTPRQLAVLFSEVQLSGNPAGVAHYLTSFSLSGMEDLRAGLRYGAGGINELLQRNERLYIPTLPQRVAIGLSWQRPLLGLALKWSLYLLGGFLLAAALHFAWPAVSALERPLQVRGFHLAREVLFALGFLVVVLLLSEPFLAQESQKLEFPFRLRLPTIGSVVPAVGTTNVKVAFMNGQTLLPLLLFFVLQGLLYVACLVKLAEIRRQRVPTRIKLRLLENEDHLFDAGLYLGFVGTIISLILFSLGVMKPSLMAAYSSTSFGIIFVSFFKICHLRPLRRKMLMEAESAGPETVAPLGARPVATPT